VEGRAAHHEVGARLADLRAVEEDADEVERGVLAALGEAVLGGHRADDVALEARLQTFVHGVVIVLVTVLVIVIVRVIVRVIASWGRSPVFRAA
jgi:hypothetical protein